MCSLSVFFIVWYIATAIMHLMPDYCLPSPVAVLQAFIAKLTHKAPDGGTLFQHIAASLKVALSGYVLGAVVGIPLGICMAWFRRIDLFVTPLFDLIRPVPTIAWIPLMILWFGIDLGAKAAIIFVSAFVPCVINSYAGIKQTKPVHLWVAQTFGASRTKMLFTVAIPTAMPLIFTGLRISPWNRLDDPLRGGDAGRQQGPGIHDSVKPLLSPRRLDYRRHADHRSHRHDLYHRTG